MSRHLLGPQGANLKIRLESFERVCRGVKRFRLGGGRGSRYVFAISRLKQLASLGPVSAHRGQRRPAGVGGQTSPAILRGPLRLKLQMVNAKANESLARSRMMSHYQLDQQDQMAYILWESRYCPRISWRLAKFGSDQLSADERGLPGSRLRLTPNRRPAGQC